MAASALTLNIPFVNTLDKRWASLSLPAARCLFYIFLICFGTTDCNIFCNFLNNYKISKINTDLQHLFQITSIQELVPRGVLIKRSSEHTCRRVISIVEFTLWYGCSPLNLLHISKTPFHKNTFVRLLSSWNLRGQSQQ